MKKKIAAAAVVLLCLFFLSYFVNNSVEKENTESEWLTTFERDDRLLFLNHVSYDYGKDWNPLDYFGFDIEYNVQKIYSEAEITETSHAIFDEQNRLVYALSYPSDAPGYIGSCEENFYERNDRERTCCHVTYIADIVPYRLSHDPCYYVADQRIRETEYYQFSANGDLISYLVYHKDSASSQLWWDFGYQAEYDGEYLMSELYCSNKWGTNLYGTWTYNVYQYDAAGNRILKVHVTEDDISLYVYEYDDMAKQITRYDYLVKEEWELVCKDGCVYSFYTGYSDYFYGYSDYLECLRHPAVRKTAADGTVLIELFHGVVCEMGQQNYLIQQEVKDSIGIHRYTVQPGDSLWQIADDYYGHATYFDILYLENQKAIGPDKNMLQPGTYLHMPEIIAAEDTKR